MNYQFDDGSIRSEISPGNHKGLVDNDHMAVPGEEQIASMSLCYNIYVKGVPESGVD